MLCDVLPLLRCPHCTRPLSLAGGVARCPQGHTYDVARQGYLNLLPGGSGTGTADSLAMVQAREEFLSGGHYDAIGDAVADLVCRGPVVDVGAGTGHHLARVLDQVDGPGLALDVSRPAARQAARCHPRAGSIVADAWRDLPVRDAVAGAVLSIFAPRGPAEAARVLAPGGRFVVVTPTPRHLVELVEELGLVTVDPRKDERLGRQLGAFNLVDRHDVQRRLALSGADVRAVVGMGPSARHLDARALPELAGPPREVTVSVTVAAYEVAGN